MSTKTVKGRVSNKHKTETEWLLDVYPNGDRTQDARTDAFIPLAGELIIYDPDSVYDYPRFKFGNEVDNVDALPFITEDSTVPSMSFITTPETSPLEAFDKMRARGLMGQWTVVNLSGSYTACYGLFLNWYGDDVYCLTGINLTNGGFASNTNAWRGKNFGDFQLSFRHTLNEGQYNALNTTDKTVLGAINEVNTKVGEIGLSKGTDATASKTLKFGDTFSAVTDTAVSGLEVTDTTTTYTLPSDRLFVTMTPTGTVIPAGADLNTTTYLKVGRYYQSQTAIAKQITNCPVNAAFMMEVWSPLSTTIDNEDKAYVYRLRKIIHYSTGAQYIQFCNTSKTAGAWTYGSWYAVPRAAATYTNTTLDDGTVIANNGSTAQVGNATQPVYVNSAGAITKCTYTLGKSVPSDAIFTDTDEKVKTTERANNETHFLTGTPDATTGELKYDSLVHFGTESGELCMKSCNLNTSANPAKLVYDDTKKSIKFVFN